MGHDNNVESESWFANNGVYFSSYVHEEIYELMDVKMCFRRGKRIESIHDDNKELQVVESTLDLALDETQACLIRFEGRLKADEHYPSSSSDDSWEIHEHKFSNKVVEYQRINLPCF